MAKTNEQKKLILPLQEFIKDVYKIDIDDIVDPTGFWFDHSWIKLDDYEIEDFREKYKVTEDELNNEEIGDMLYRVKARAYEESYTDNYYGNVVSELTRKIEYDFEKLNTFFTVADGEVSSDEELLVDVDWSGDKLIITGNIHKLEEIIVQCVNGYGMFHYNSVEEFREVYYGDNIKKNVESHWHWLKELESIYGTIYDFFKFKTDGIDAYGSTDYTKRQLEDHLHEEGWNWILNTVRD